MNDDQSPEETLEGKELSLVDNRIVAGASSWVATAQPIVVCTLHPKQNKPAQRALIAEMLKRANQGLKTDPEPTPEAS